MVYYDIQKFINYCIECGFIEKEDEIVLRNYILDILHISDWQDVSINEHDYNVDEILGNLVDYACKNGVIEDTQVSRDLFDTKLMGLVTPLPSKMAKDFFEMYSKSPKDATDWYYDVCKKLNYVRAGRIANDLKWQYDSQYGSMDITINRSKPEKDPRDIAKARAAASTSYPKCQLCAENMGFAGNSHNPAKQNLRPIPLKINNEDWFLQYSPYGYYNEHCILFNKKHIPMRIDGEIFKKLFDFLDLFPHYFIGSNADLPIVGGSILSHEHFQGGNYTFAMAKAPEEYRFSVDGFEDVYAATIKWPMSVVRLRYEKKEKLSAACNKILEAWRYYSDKDAGIFAFEGDTPHNTVTVIARMNGNMYECDLVLRNNITSSSRPLGVFHPNPSLHHIKKENIGLIEVMGLAVLPARLAKELEEVKVALIEKRDLTENELTKSHAHWAETIIKNHPEFNIENATDIIRSEVGKVFEQVLCDAGVFKRDDFGQNHFKRFIDTL